MELERESRRQPRHIKYAISQNLIDDILKNELKNFNFPKSPVYNESLRRAYGLTRYKSYPWGETEVTSIEVGKQGKADRNFLIDTLLHEYYEALIVNNQYKDKFYERLHYLPQTNRHEWVNKKIADFFNER